MSRYPKDVLAPGWQKAGKPTTTELPAEFGMVLEDPTSGFVGALVRVENGLLVLEDRRGKRRSFPLGPGFWLDGRPVAITAPKRAANGGPTHTASGSRATRTTAKVALPSRIYVEGRHDAELVEKVWGDDLRHVGVVVEYLGGIDDLPAIVTEFAPQQGRRLGVLVDHLVPGSKESRIVQQVTSPWVMITGHRFIDIWQAIRPEVMGIKAWPVVPRDVDFKKGTLAALGLPNRDQTDIARAWQSMLARVRTFRDLDPDFIREVEKLIDFVTQDHLDEID